MSTSEHQAWPTGSAPAAAMCGEDERASVLASFGIDRLAGDSELDSIVRFAAHLCDASIALVSVVERDRQFFLARLGIDVNETPRETSFCAHAMLGTQPLEVPDACEDERFARNPLVTGAPHIRFYAGAPLISSEGAPLGSLCVIDPKPRPDGLTDLQREGLQVLAQAVKARLGLSRVSRSLERDRSQREEQIRSLADAMPDVAFSTDPGGQVRYYNSRWYDLTGLQADFDGHGRGDHLHPDDRENAIAQWNEAREQKATYSGEARLRCADGSYRWMLVRAVPLADGDGNIVHWFGTMGDIDENHRLSESRDLLARELAHRIKNIFAVISGLITMRARKRPEVREFADELTSTLRALGRAHDYIRPVEGKAGNNLAGLLAELLEPYSHGEADRVRISGDNCSVDSRAATPLALVFHELATNAAKYGALAHESGKLVTVITQDGDSIAIDWTESGGPAPDTDTPEGFGARLVRMAIEGQLGGTLDREWTADGLRVTVRLPRAKVSG